MQGNASNNSGSRLYTDKWVLWLLTCNQGSEKERYRELLYNLLPEALALNQHKSKKKAFKKLLRQWSQASDLERQTISHLLKWGIRLAKWGRLIAFGIGFGVLAMVITAIYVAGNIGNKNGDLLVPVPVLTPVPVPTKLDCVINNNCTIILPRAIVKDIYSPNFDKGQLTVKFMANGKPDDYLKIHNQGKGSGKLGIDGNKVTYGSTQIGSFQGGDGTNPLIVTFNANATREIAQSLVRRIAYQNISDNPTLGSRTVELQITDGDGGISDVFRKDIRVIDDKGLTLQLPSNQTATQDSNLSINGIRISAPDNEKVTLTLQVDRGRITIKSDVTGGVSADKIEGNGTNKVTVVGTVGQINVTLANPEAVSYIYRGNIDNNISSTITATATSFDKGLVWPPKAGKPKTDRKELEITVKPLNPPPAVTVPGNQFVSRSAGKAIAGIKVSDPNNQSMIVKLRVFSSGAIAVKADVPGGLSADRIANNNTREVTLTGGIAAINKTLADSAGVIYRGDRSGKYVLVVTANDGEKTDQKTINITVNDNPVISVPPPTSRRPPSRSAPPRQPSPPPVSPTPTVSATNARVAGNPGTKNMRSGPGTAYRVVGIVTTGDRIQITGSGYDSGGFLWYKVYHPKSGQRGWIAAQLVERD